MPRRKRIGDILLEEGLVDEGQLRSALTHQGRWGKRLGESLVDLGFISETQLIVTLSRMFRVPAVEMKKIQIKPEALQLIPGDYCEKHQVIPLAIREVEGRKQLVVAFSDPSDLTAADELRFLTNMPIYRVIGSASEIERAVRNRYPERSGYSKQEEIKEISLVKIKDGEEEDQHKIFRDGRFETFPERQLEDPGIEHRLSIVIRAMKELVKTLTKKGILSEEEGHKLFDSLER